MNNNHPNFVLDIHTLFPFTLDQFQQEAISHLQQGKSVVVCAPTGSGKTVIAEYAIYRAIAKGRRVFYTTPLKALSNQKFRDLQDKFHAKAETGLITGDILINPDAQIVVMTTEIFRNMLYETPIGQVGTSLENVETVILDECHYISDRGRGTVWEESIIYCPPSIQLVALSATIGNPEELTDWINQVRRVPASQKCALAQISSCELVNSDFRPVPLQFYFSSKKGLFPLLNEKKDQLNKQLTIKEQKGKRQRFSREDCPSLPEIIQQLQEKQMLPSIYIIFSRRGCDQAVRALESFNLLSQQESEEICCQLFSFFFANNPLLEKTQDRILTFFEQQNPNLYEKLRNFIAGNPNGREELLTVLIDNPELKIQLFERIAAEFQFVRFEQLEPISRGIASHHAGVLPAWKELVEQLFEIGLIKVVFATATLAAGINMPARTTVISALSKRTDEGHSMLTPSEFLQIAGRAGRRGMDEVGYVVTVQTPFEGAKDAASLALASPEKLKSCFTPSYGMVLNLLQKHSIEEAKTLLEKSFAEYLAQLDLAPTKQEITNLTTEQAKLDITLAGIDDKQIQSYRKLRDRLKEEKRLLKVLERQAQSAKKRLIAPLLNELSAGRIIHIKGKHVTVSQPLTAILLNYIDGPGKFPDLLCLGADNRWYIVPHADVVDINPEFIPLSELANLAIPTPEKVQLGFIGKGDETTIQLSEKIAQRAAEIPPAPEVVKQEKRINSVESQLEQHPFQRYKNPSHILEMYYRRQTLAEKLHKLRNKYKKLQSRKPYYWEDFLSLIDIAREFNALDGYLPTPLGQACATIRGENELWLGLVFMSGKLDNLEPAYLGPAVSALITENLRPDTWANYLPAPEIIGAFEDMDENGLSLKELRRRLYQAQNREDRDISIPVWLEYELMGLLEAWCRGVEWQEICENTSLDEGDLVRLIRRTIDVLWQIPQVPWVSENLKRNAQEAIYLMRRFPV